MLAAVPEVHGDQPVRAENAQNAVGQVADDPAVAKRASVPHLWAEHARKGTACPHRLPGEGVRGIIGIGHGTEPRTAYKHHGTGVRNIHRGHGQRKGKLAHALYPLCLKQLPEELSQPRPLDESLQAEGPVQQELCRRAEKPQDIGVEKVGGEAVRCFARIEGEKDFPQLLGRVSRREKRSDNGARACAGYGTDFDPLLLERLQHADVRRAAHAAAREGKSRFHDGFPPFGSVIQLMNRRRTR